MRHARAYKRACALVTRRPRCQAVVGMCLHYGLEGGSLQMIRTFSLTRESHDGRRWLHRMADALHGSQ